MKWTHLAWPEQPLVRSCKEHPNENGPSGKYFPYPGAFGWSHWVIGLSMVNTFHLHNCGKSRDICGFCLDEASGAGQAIPG